MGLCRSLWMVGYSAADSPGDEKARLPLQAGFAEMDITPQLGVKPIFMAGFGQNRKALKIHDPLKVRAVVLGQGRTNWRWFPST